MTTTNPWDIIERYIPDFSRMTDLIKKVNDFDPAIFADHQTKSDFYSSLTVAETIFLEALGIEDVDNNQAVLAVAKYLQVLDLLDVNLTTPIKDFTEEQLEANNNSSEFISAMLGFKAMWKLANIAAKQKKLSQNSHLN